MAPFVTRSSFTFLRVPVVSKSKSPLEFVESDFYRASRDRPQKRSANNYSGTLWTNFFGPFRSTSWSPEYNPSPPSRFNGSIGLCAPKERVTIPMRDLGSSSSAIKYPLARGCRVKKRVRVAEPLAYRGQLW